MTNHKKDVATFSARLDTIRGENKFLNYLGEHTIYVYGSTEGRKENTKLFYIS